MGFSPISIIHFLNNQKKVYNHLIWMSFNNFPWMNVLWSPKLGFTDLLGNFLVLKYLLTDQMNSTHYPTKNQKTLDPDMYVDVSPTIPTNKLIIEAHIQWRTKTVGYDYQDPELQVMISVFHYIGQCFFLCCGWSPIYFYFFVCRCCSIFFLIMTTFVTGKVVGFVQFYKGDFVV